MRVETEFSTRQNQDCYWLRLRSCHSLLAGHDEKIRYTGICPALRTSVSLHNLDESFCKKQLLQHTIVRTGYMNSREQFKLIT